MSVGPLGPSPFGRPLGFALQVRPRDARVPAALLPRRPAAGAALRELAGGILALRESLRELRLGARVRGGGGARAAPEATSGALGLGATTAATLSSTEEVNATPTSFATHAPAVAGLSTAAPLVDGVYDGSQGDDTLTFEFKREGVVGSTKVEVEVRDGEDHKLENVVFDSDYVPGTPVELKNGLTLSLSDGLAVKNETFQLDVRATVGTAVDPDDPLDGSGLSDPDLEYGLDVTPGSFEVEGVSIDVLAGDSLHDVLDRITASSAGVTATFDAASETVRLVSDTPGPTGTVTLGADTSGFLAATKLAGATLVPGTEDTVDDLLVDLPAFADVTAGGLLLNGVEVAIDPAADTLQEVLGRLESTAPGLSATYDAGADRVTLASSSGEAFSLGGDTSGLLVALGIAPGTYAAAGGAGGAGRFLDQAAARRGLADLADDLRSLVGPERAGLAASFHADRARDALEGALRAALEPFVADADANRLEPGAGLTFRPGAEDGSLLEIDGDALARAVRGGDAVLRELLHGDDGESGLLDRLQASLDEVTADLAAALPAADAVGLRVDLDA